MTTILETPRVQLREMATADLDFIAALLGDPEVMRFWPRPFTRPEAEEWLHNQQNRYARDGHGYWLAVARDTGTPLGQVGLLMTELDGKTEPALGYILAQSAWGRGLATEAAAGVLAWALRRGYPRVLCLVRPENVPSLRVAYRLNLMPERYVDCKGLAHLVFTTVPGSQPPALT